MAAVVDSEADRIAVDLVADLDTDRTITIIGVDIGARADTIGAAAGLAAR